MWRATIAACALLLASLAAAQADALSVEALNASEPTLCAEKDNVYLKLQSAAARRFTVEAVHPAYIGTVVVDRWAPDFSNCDMSNDPVFKFEKQSPLLIHLRVHQTCAFRAGGTGSRPPGWNG